MLQRETHSRLADKCAGAARRLALPAVLCALVALQGCAPSLTGYLGHTSPPHQRRLVFSNAIEPDSIDPALVNSNAGGRIAMALFEGLVTYHPQTLEPIQGIATHLDVNDDATIFTFSLRGGASPRGRPIPDGRDYLSRGAPPDPFVPARWSNGAPVTAHDFVAAWRRVIDPATAADLAYFMFYVRNAEAINAGRGRVRLGGVHQTGPGGREIAVSREEFERLALPGAEWVGYTPDDLGVRAVDDYTFEVTLEAPTPYFPQVVCNWLFCAVPIQTVRACAEHGLRWTDPDTIVTSGAFRLADHVPYHEYRLVKSPTYWDAATTGLEEIVFLPIEDHTTCVNLYKAGEVHLLAPNTIPQELVTPLRATADYQVSPWLASYYYTLNTRRAPFDDPRVRRALNMAIDKRAVCEFLGNGELPATHLTPPGIPGYDPPEGDPYDPGRALELLAEAGYARGRDRDGNRLRVEILFNTSEKHSQIAQLVQSNLQRNLGIDVALVNQEWKVYLAACTGVSYGGLARRTFTADYVDPNTFLNNMLTTSANNGAGWSDPEYDRLIAEANRRSDPAERFALLSRAERRMLDACPVIPLYFPRAAYLRKPYVTGVESSALDVLVAKFVSIDADWRPPN